MDDANNSPSVVMGPGYLPVTAVKEEGNVPALVLGPASQIFYGQVKSGNHERFGGTAWLDRGADFCC